MVVGDAGVGPVPRRRARCGTSSSSSTTSPATGRAPATRWSRRRPMSSSRDGAATRAAAPLALAAAGACCRGAALLLPARRAQQGAGTAPGPPAPGPAGGAAGTGGAAVYAKYCAQCHGDKGDGRGIAAPLPAPGAARLHLRQVPDPQHRHRRPAHRRRPQAGSSAAASPAPRCRPSRSSPTSRTSSTRWSPTCSRFSPQVQERPGAPELIEHPRRPRLQAPTRLEAARKVYNSIGCAGCHGDEGRGDGPSAPTLQGRLGPARSAPPTCRGRGPSTAAARARTSSARISTGLNGTPMAGFAERAHRRAALAAGRLHHLAGRRRDREGAVRQPGGRQAGRGRARPRARARSSSRAPSRRSSRCSGRSIQPGRDFQPATIAVEARAVYNGDEVALLVTWHDIQADRGGNNGPDFELPEQEEHPGLAPTVSGGGQAPATADPFADEEAGVRRRPAPSAEPAFADPSPKRAPAATPRPPQREAPIRTTEEEADARGSRGGGGGGGGRRRRASSPTPSPCSSRGSSPTACAAPTSSSATPQDPVELWFVDLAQPRQGRAVGGAGQRRPAAGRRASTPEVRATFDKGEWSVIFKRKRDAGRGIAFPDDSLRADRLLGLGRLPPRARQQARAHHLVQPLRAAGRAAVAVVADGQGGGRRAARRAAGRSRCARRRAPPPAATDAATSTAAARCRLASETNHVQQHPRPRRQLAPQQPRHRHRRRAGQALRRQAGGLPRLRRQDARLPVQADGVHAPRGVPRRAGAAPPAQDPRQPHHHGARADLRLLPGVDEGSSASARASRSKAR